jgi:hypothetical protein
MNKLLAIALLLLGGMSSAWATGLSDLKFGQYQIADSQWDVQACTQTTTCQIYSKNPGTAYNIPWWSGQIQWAPGDYIRFQSNAQKDADNPWLAVLYDSNNVAKSNMGTGHIINMGADYFFFVGNDNDTGQLFSMTQGFSNSDGVTWTGTLNPTQPEVDSYAAGGSTTPLASGESSGTPVVTAGVGSASQPVATGSSTVTNTDITYSYPPSWSDAVPTMTIGPGPLQSLIVSPDITMITAQPVVTTTTETPVTTTYYNNGTSTTSSGPSTSTSSSSVDYSSTLQVSPRPYTVNIGLANQIYLNQIGDSNTVNIRQQGSANRVSGVNQPSAQVLGSNNTLDIRQGGYGGSPNGVDLFVQGSGNLVRVLQGINASDTSASGHLSSVSITGDSNQVSHKQSNDGGLGIHSATTTVTGDSNYVGLGQYNNGGKTMTTTINGNNNTLNASQSGTGQHSLSTTMTGNGNSATVQQSGSYAASASITLNNAGGPSSATVIQNANSAPTAYSVYQSCSNPAGCGVSVIQNK